MNNQGLPRDFSGNMTPSQMSLHQQMMNQMMQSQMTPGNAMSNMPGNMPSQGWMGNMMGTMVNPGMVPNYPSPLMTGGTFHGSGTSLTGNSGIGISGMTSGLQNLPPTKTNTEGFQSQSGHDRIGSFSNFPQSDYMANTYSNNNSAARMSGTDPFHGSLGHQTAQGTAQTYPKVGPIDFQQHSQYFTKGKADAQAQPSPLKSILKKPKQVTDVLPDNANEKPTTELAKTTSAPVTTEMITSLSTAIASSYKDYYRTYANRQFTIEDTYLPMGIEDGMKAAMAAPFTKATETENKQSQNPPHSSYQLSSSVTPTPAQSIPTLVTTLRKTKDPPVKRKGELSPSPVLSKMPKIEDEDTDMVIACCIFSFLLL